MESKWKACILTGALLLSSVPGIHAAPQDGQKLGASTSKFRHVLLISIDGMHALDFENCAKGISTINGGQPYCPNLAELAQPPVNHPRPPASQPPHSSP